MWWLRPQLLAGVGLGLGVDTVGSQQAAISGQRWGFPSCLEHSVEHLMIASHGGIMEISQCGEIISH